MNSKKRFEGRQLLLVVAIFGILLMHITSAEDESTTEDTTTPTTAATTVESPGETTVEKIPETQETSEAVPVALSTSRTQDATDLSSVEMTTPTIVAGGTVTDNANTSEAEQGHSQSDKVGFTTESGTERLTVILVSTTGRGSFEETNSSLENANATTTENVASSRETTTRETTRETTTRETTTRETTTANTTTVALPGIDGTTGAVDDLLDKFESKFESNISTDPQTSSQATTGLIESSKGESATSSTVASTAASKKSSSAPVAESDDSKANMRNPDIWEAHRGLFLTVLILISVCVVVTVVCCLCMAWRGRGREKHPDKQPISMEEARDAPTAVSNPIPDAEMIRDEAPMQERENPAVTPNGGGQHISKTDEDNGWVVPLDELSKAEKEKPEVENTRL